MTPGRRFPNVSPSNVNRPEPPPSIRNKAPRLESVRLNAGAGCPDLIFLHSDLIGTDFGLFLTLVASTVFALLDRRRLPRVLPRRHGHLARRHAAAPAGALHAQPARPSRPLRHRHDALRRVRLGQAGAVRPLARQGEPEDGHAARLARRPHVELRRRRPAGDPDQVRLGAVHQPALEHPARSSSAARCSRRASTRACS